MRHEACLGDTDSGSVTHKHYMRATSSKKEEEEYLAGRAALRTALQCLQLGTRRQ